MEISITYAIKIWLTLWGTLETLSIWITSQYFHWINQPHIIKCTNIKINISYMCMRIIVLWIFAKLFFTGSSAIFIVIQGIEIQKNTNHLLFRWLWSVKCNIRNPDFDHRKYCCHKRYQSYINEKWALAAECYTAGTVSEQGARLAVETVLELRLI